MRKLSPFSRRDMLKAGGAAAYMAAGAVLMPAEQLLKHRLDTLRYQAISGLTLVNLKFTNVKRWESCSAAGV